MSLKRTLKVLTAVIFCFATTSAKADLTAILKEYSALTHDLGILTGILHGFRGSTATDPADMPKLVEQVDSAKTWVSIALYQSSCAVLKGLLKETNQSLSELRSDVAKQQLETFAKSITAGYVEKSGAHGREYWDDAREVTNGRKQAAMVQLEEILKLLKQKCESKSSELEKFIAAARQKDPNFISKDQEQEIARLKAEFVRQTQIIEELRREQAVERERLAALKKEEEIAKQSIAVCGSIEELRRAQAAENERLALARKELEASKKELATCQSSKAVQTAECQRLQQQIESKRLELENVYDETLKTAITRQRAKSDAEQANKDETKVLGLDLLPAELKASLEKTMLAVFDAAVTAFFPGKRAAGSFIKFVVEVTQCKANAMSKKNPKIYVTVRLGADGMKAPVIGTFECKFEDLRSQVKAFVDANVPAVLKAAMGHYEMEVRFREEAEAEARRQNESIRAAAYAAPTAPPPPAYAPGYNTNSTNDNSNNARYPNLGIPSAQLFTFSGK